MRVESQGTKKKYLSPLWKAIRTICSSAEIWLTLTRSQLQRSISWPSSRMATTLLPPPLLEPLLPRPFVSRSNSSLRNEPSVPSATNQFYGRGSRSRNRVRNLGISLDTQTRSLCAISIHHRGGEDSDRAVNLTPAQPLRLLCKAPLLHLALHHRVAALYKTTKKVQPRLALQRRSPLFVPFAKPANSFCCRF